MEYKLDVELSPELEPYRGAIEATIEPYVEIQLTDNSQPTLWQSKFGGVPYMPKDFEYPKTEAGECLYLLAQINFAEVPEFKGLPNKGILQFYLADDDMYGCDFYNPTKQDKFRVIYFPEADLAEPDLVTDFILTQPEKHNSPLQGCCAIAFKINHAPISASDRHFNVFNIYDADENVDSKFEEYWDKFYSAGHKLLGYPCFTQDDPRPNLAEDEPYILLFQIDSDSNESGCNILWGDMGIGNFFIKRSRLAKLDFSEILYNWD